MPPRHSPAEIDDLLIGTWLGISIIADMLAETGVIERELLAIRLAEAVMLARGSRRIPLRSILWLVQEMARLPAVGDD